MQYILYTNKHHKLRHSKSGRQKFGSGHRQNDEKKKKPRVKHEPRSTHGRAVKKKEGNGFYISFCPFPKIISLRKSPVVEGNAPPPPPPQSYYSGTLLEDYSGCWENTEGRKPRGGNSNVRETKRWRSTISSYL